LIDHLTKNFKINQPSTLKGGDDAAVLDFKEDKSGCFY
jgi:thiamine-monophosphate kinase